MPKRILFEEKVFKKMFELQRWQNLWRSFGAQNDVDKVFSQIEKAYSERQRAYHNTNHIIHCLREFDCVKHLLERPSEVELAIWFHDAIYKPFSSKNEANSALWAEKELKKANIPDKFISNVKELILVTTHKGNSIGKDAQYMVDIDLSILGSLPEEFHRYEQGIRKEYQWIPLRIYRSKRIELLKMFMHRKHIFLTEFFQNKYEKMARENIEESINSSSKAI